MNKIQELMKFVLKGKGTDLKPQDVEAYDNRAIKKCGLGQYESAIADFDRVIELNPQDMEIYYYREKAKHALGLHKSAEADDAEAKELGYVAQ